MSHWKHTITGIDWDEHPLWVREQLFTDVCNKHGVELEEAAFSVMWEDPSDPDAPLHVTTPSQTWWAMALHGGILPPVEVYWALKHDESQPDFKSHAHGRGHLLHDTPPMRAMTPEEAIQYLIMKVLPPAVWRDYKGNRTILRIVPRELVPSDRSFRNAWRIAQDMPLEEEAA